MGALITMVVFPLPWPVKRRILFKSSTLSDGKLEIFYEPSGQIRVRIGNSEKHTEAVTATLHMPELVFNQLAISWTESGIEIRLANELVGASFDLSRIPSTVTPKPYGEGKGPRYDFSEENLAAKDKRLSDYQGWHGGSRPKANRIRGDKDYAFAALRDELNQIIDLLIWIRAGRSYHLTGLASRIRMTISTGDPLPLAQACAAMTNRPIIVYTASDPRKKNFKLPKDIVPSHRLITAVTGTPNPIYRNPVDLDVWLDLPAAQIGKEVLTNRQVLKKIGDTRGSHLDLDIYPTVAFLRDGESELSGVKQEDLEVYLLHIAEVVVSVARELLGS